MNFELFIVKKFIYGNKPSFSRPIVRISVASIAIGLAAMLISVAVVRGFQVKVSEKVTGFGAHIQIGGYDVIQSFEENPVLRFQPFYPDLDTLSIVRHIQVFATKAGIVKTTDQIDGVILKGIDSDFDWSFFKDNIVEGKPLVFNDSVRSNDVIISSSLASRLNLILGDPIRMYFISPDAHAPIGRKFRISGIYKTGLDEFDKMYVLGDIRHIQKLNGWDQTQVGGFEVMLNDLNDLDYAANLIYNNIGPDLNIRTIRELYPQIFEWLSLHDMNALVIIVLMLIVAGITMISTLLIIILERSGMIGVLKALGTQNRSIRKIFIYNSVYIIGKGLFWGNVAGIGIIVIQYYTGLIKLDEASYYVSEVPVLLSAGTVVILNVISMIVCVLMLILPSYIVTRIAPVRIIRFG
ncbi:MAG: ABC transporter permease [Bacteroidales bacterium]|nr:ABC transporter permease [Bacteroidales bacterium]